MVEGARLLSECGGNSTEGSNPSLSAIFVWDGVPSRGGKWEAVATGNVAMNWTILGVIAGLITVSGFFPQIYKGYRTRRLDDLSYFMLGLLGAGMFLWILYGVHIRSFPVIMANIIGVSCNVVLMVMKHRFSRKGN